MKIRKTLAFVMALLLTMGMLSMAVFAAPAVEISTKEQLNAIRDDMTADYILTADIEFTEADFAPNGAFYNDGMGFLPLGLEAKTQPNADGEYISYVATPFTGHFDGNGHSITGLKISTTSTDAVLLSQTALFSENDGSIKNLKLYVNISAKFDTQKALSAYAYLAGLVSKNNGTISNCSVIADIHGEVSGPIHLTAGGVVAHNQGTVENCHAGGSVTAVSDSDPYVAVGGIAGQSDTQGRLLTCYSTAIVNGSATSNLYLGSLVGWNRNIISHCYALSTTSCIGRDQALYGTERTTGLVDEAGVRLPASFAGFDFESTWVLWANGPSLRIFSTEHQHEWDNGKVTTEPTCTAKGVKTFTCEVCGETKTEEIDMIAHKWDNGKVTTEPTCTAKGVKTFTCEACGETKTEEVAELGHDWETEARVDKEATCVENGSKSIHCKRCDATKDETVIVATGSHTWDNGKVTVAAICDKEGAKIFTCKVCGETKTEVVPANGHKPGAWTLVKKATTVSEGLQVKTCKTCGKTVQTQVIAKMKITEEASVKFNDINKTDWYYKAVNFASNSGLFAGTSNTTFAPNMEMTRGMFVTVLGRLNGVNAAKSATKFKDVKADAYYSGYVKWASDAGIVSGTGKTTFAPDANVSREQICKMMVEYCNFAGIKLKAVNAPMTFKDADQISKWAKNYVTDCQRAGLVSGSNGKFSPQGNATRVEVAQILMNFANNYLK